MEQEQRQKVVAIAHSFLSTPYHHMGMVKGAGVDCLTILALTYHEAGLIPRIAIPHYPPDFMLHRDAEQYMEGLLQYATEVDTPLPGDIVLWQFGRCFSHSAIVVDWPIVIHAYIGRSVTLENAEAATWLTHIGEPLPSQGKIRPKKFFSYWAKKDS